MCCEIMVVNIAQDVANVFQYSVGCPITVCLCRDVHMYSALCKLHLNVAYQGKKEGGCVV